MVILKYVVIGLMAGMTPAQAQDWVYLDGSTAASCLAETEGFTNKRQCIGRTASPCMQLAEDRSAHADCAKSELDFWQGRLDGNYESLRAEFQSVNVNAPVIATLDAMQKAWVQYRDARCDHSANGYQDTDSYNVVRFECLMETTAEQALVLERMLY